MDKTYLPDLISGLERAGENWGKEGKKKVWQAALPQQMASMEKEKALEKKRKKLSYSKAFTLLVITTQQKL